MQKILNLLFVVLKVSNRLFVDYQFRLTLYLSEYIYIGFPHKNNRSGSWSLNFGPILTILDIFASTFISDRVVFTLELSIILCFGIPPIFKKNNLSKIIISNPYYIYQGSGFFIFLRVVYFHPIIFLPHSNSTQY